MLRLLSGEIKNNKALLIVRGTCINTRLVGNCACGMRDALTNTASEYLETDMTVKLNAARTLREPRWTGNGQVGKVGYGRGESSKYVCFTCRLCFHGTHVCPRCREDMKYVGTHFRAPRKNDRRAWKILETMQFGGSYRDGAGYMPKNSHELALHRRARLKYEGPYDRLAKCRGLAAGPLTPLYNPQGRHVYGRCCSIIYPDE